MCQLARLWGVCVCVCVHRQEKLTPTLNGQKWEEFWADIAGHGLPQGASCTFQFMTLGVSSV